ncbi:MAG TPA: hypothetical protein VIT41_03140 [Microlunatus sp.]
MRWPWERVPWGRGRGASASESAAGDAGSPSPGSADPPSPAFQAAPAGVPAAWTHVPPLQRSVSDTTAVAPPAAFRASLTTHQNPSFLAPLGHLVDPDGPGGLVGGLASSVGGPIPYEGVDELRVPERPTPAPGPAVQRRIATLRPDHEDAGVNESAELPTTAVDVGGTDTTDAGTIIDAPTVGTSAAETRPERNEPAPDVASSPTPLTVARLADSPLPGPNRPGNPVSSDTEATPANQTETLGSGGSAVVPASAPAPDPAAPTPAATSSATPLTVPVQRSAAAASSRSGPTAPTLPVGDAARPAMLRPVSPTPTTEAVPPATQATAAEPAPPTALENATRAEPEAALSAPNPAPVADLVVARSAVDPTDQHLDHAPLNDLPPTAPHTLPTAPDTLPTAPDAVPATGEPPTSEVALTGLLASRPPLGEPAPLALPEPPSATETRAGDIAPLTVPSSTNPPPGSGPILQRQFAEPTATVPHPAVTSSSSLPAAPMTGAASSSGEGPAVAPLTPGSPVRVLDDLGYPPLIARSVQRRALDAEAGRLSASAGSVQGVDPDPSSTPPQAPLSGFTAAISALQDPSPGPPLGGDVVEPPAHSPGAGHDSALVVARRLPPNETGRLPAPEARLQPPDQAAARPAPLAGMVQRSLIAGRSPVASPTSTASSAPTTTAPAVQRLRYEDVTGPSEHRLGVHQPAGTAEPEIGLSEPGIASAAMSAVPPSAAWSPAPPATSRGGGGWSTSAGAGTSGPSRPGDPLAVLQRSPTAAGTQQIANGTSHPVTEITAHLRFGEPAPSLVSPAWSSSEPPPPMIQRRFDVPTPSTSVTPPTSAEPPSLAVSGRSVGLAEMFAMAAAQSSAGDATVQRSPETEVQLTSLDSAPAESAPSAGTSAAPPPAAAAQPPSGAELEEMARRLYEPLSARLRAELWQDRERSGLLTDLRP